DLDDDVAGAQACFVRRGTDERRHDDGLTVAALDGHAYAVILAALIFAQVFEIFGIEEVGMRVESAQHLGDRTLIDGFVGTHGVREVLLDGRVDPRERFHTGLDVVVRCGSGCYFEPRAIHSADDSGAKYKSRDEIKGATMLSHADE